MKTSYRMIFAALALGTLIGCASGGYTYPHYDTPYYSEEYFAKKEQDIWVDACTQVADVYKQAAAMRDDGIPVDVATTILMRHRSVTSTATAASVYSNVRLVYADPNKLPAQRIYDTAYVACMEDAPA